MKWCQIKTIFFYVCVVYIQLITQMWSHVIMLTWGHAQLKHRTSIACMWRHYRSLGEMKYNIIMFLYVLQSSGISRKSGVLIVQYSQKKEWISIVLRILQLGITLNHWSDSCGFFSKMYLSKWALQSNRKLKMSHVRLQTDFPRSHHIWYVMQD